MQTALITDPMSVGAVLIGTIALLFTISKHPVLGKIFKYVPLLLFCYFVPTLLSNTGIIPLKSDAYTFIKKWLLPASLFLLTLSVDLPSILKLGKKTLIMFFGATISIALGGPISYLLAGGLIPESLGDQGWKGLAALSGSWIGGTANFVAMGENFGATDATISLMVVPDVVVASVWMAVLLFFAGREKEMDDKIGADRTALDELREKIAKFQKEVARPTNLPDMLAILALGIGFTVVCTKLGGMMPVISLPTIGPIVKGFTWIVILVTLSGVALSFTKVRNLEGSGASTMGSVFLYILVASIGAKGDFLQIINAPGIVAVCAIWMGVHAFIMLFLRRVVKAPIFLLAVSSQANIGGAASAPVVASAYSPSLAAVGVLLAVFGYAVGNVAGLVCGILLEYVHLLVG